MRNCNKNVNITLHEIIDEIQLGESTVEIRNAIEIIKFILGFIPVINCITDIYQLVDDVTQALSDDGKISGGEWLALGADVIFLGLDVVAAGDIIKAVKAAKTAEKKAAKRAGSVPTTKAAQKATKAAKNAVRKAAQADEAKQIATGAAKDVIKKVTEGAANNVMDEYVATPENAGMPNAVKRESLDIILLIRRWEGIQKGMYRLKVQHILYLIAVVFGVIGFLNFQSSMRTSSYEKVSGYITDVEETSELTKAGYKPRYNYIIHWFRDGEEYQRAVYEALSEPDESATEFWASLDNTDAIASEPAGIRTEAYLNWLVAALSAILGGIIDARNSRKTGKNRSRRRDERENAQILWSVVAFCMAIGVAITGFSLWISYRDGYYINSVMKDLLLVFAIGFIGCLIGVKKNKTK